MRILIAPDKFKGSLTAAEACDAIAAGVRRAVPDAELDICPLADGGEGTVAAMAAATGGRITWFDVCGALPGTTARAPIAFLPDGQTAIIELAAASGLQQLSFEQRDPTRTTTFGTGELMRAAAEAGAKTIIIGIGGSATCDGGIGIAQAWGAAIQLTTGKIYTANERKLTGADLIRITSVHRDNPTRDAAPAGESPPRRALHDGTLLDRRGVEFIVACDVGNPLLGPDGTARIFAPQKGATPQQVEDLEAGLAKMVDRLGLAAYADLPGAGAAGGVGFGMAAFLGAKTVSGAQIVFESVHLAERLESVDLCITAEGRFDGQSLAGKAPFAVARACQAAGVPCVVLAGSVGTDVGEAYAQGVTAAVSILNGPMVLVDAVERAPALLEQAAFNVVRIHRGR